MKTLFLLFLLTLLRFTSFSQELRAVGRVRYQDIPLETTHSERIHMQRLAATGNRLFAIQVSTKLELVEFNFRTGKRLKTIDLYSKLRKSAYYNSLFKKNPNIKNINFAIVNNKLLLIMNLYELDLSSSCMNQFVVPIPIYLICNLNLTEFNIGAFGYNGSTIAGIVGDTAILYEGAVLDDSSEVGPSNQKFLFASYLVKKDTLLPVKGSFEYISTEFNVLTSQTYNEGFLFPFTTRSWKEVQYVSDGYSLYSLTGDDRIFKKIFQEKMSIIDSKSCFYLKDTLCFFKYEFNYLDSPNTKNYTVLKYKKDNFLLQTPISKAGPELKLIYGMNYQNYYSVEGQLFQSIFDRKGNYIRRFYF